MASEEWNIAYKEFEKLPLEQSIIVNTLYKQYRAHACDGMALRRALDEGATSKFSLHAIQEYDDIQKGSEIWASIQKNSGR